MPLPSNLPDLPGSPQNNNKKQDSQSLPDFDLSVKPLSSFPELPDFDDEPIEEESIEEESSNVTNDDPFEDISGEPYQDEEEDEEEEEELSLPQSTNENISHHESQENVTQEEYDEVEGNDFEEIVAPPKRTRRSREEEKENVKTPKKREYIDKKKKKIKPYGGKKNKIKINATHLDERNNLKRNALIVQIIVISLLVVLVGLGIKSVVFPSKVWSEEEIGALSQQYNDNLGFPIDAGKTFAENFTKAFLTVDNTEASRAIVSYYYTGRLVDEDYVNSRISSPNNAIQEVVTEPKVVETIALTDYSTRYIVSAAVRNGDAEEGIKNGVDSVNLQWITLSINVYYDAEQDTFAVVQGSPTIVPGNNIVSTTDVPESAPLGGTPDDGASQMLEPTIYEFIKGYAISSFENDQAIIQYIKPEFDGAIGVGFNNQVRLAGEDSEAITYETYTELNDLGEFTGRYKVRVTVRWLMDVANSEESIEYTSTYIMTLVPETNDRFLVSRFLPENYFKDEEQ